MRQFMPWIAAGAALCMTGSAPAQKAATPELAYQLTEGNNINAFLRDGPVAAHMLLRSGNDPRILFAFPGGNSGVGLWFAPLDTPAQWTLDAPPLPTELRDKSGRALHAVRAIASIDARRLTVRQAVLSNVRFLRDYQAIGKIPDAIATPPATIVGNRMLFARDRADGAPGYQLALTILNGRIEGQAILATGNGPIRMEIVAATGDAPLTGLAEADLLNDTAAKDPAARNALRFLSYREKFLAGSWRFNTYFGRDTLMSVRLLMPALQPAAIEAGINSVLARLSPEGEVAHEEALSEFALLERREKGGTGDAATLDYAMIDDDFMLAPVAASYLLDRATPAAARAYLARPVPGEASPGSAETAGALLMRNLRFVLDAAEAYVRDPRVERLIALKSGRDNGQWRDSNEGLGGGRYAYDVNAVFVPAALDAADRLAQSGVLDGFLTATDRRRLTQAGAMARHWRSRVPGLFRVSTPAAQAIPAIRRYAKSLGVPAEPAVAALGNAPLAYHAIALDAAGKPVPVIHSDEGFALLFASPAPQDIDLILASIMRPFPAGLMTDIGLLVANAAQADAGVQAIFTPAKYHGAVVWSWQQALLAAGIARQLERTDLPQSTRARLTQAQTRLWQVIQAGRAVQSSELWSWAFKDGRYQVVAFGAGKQDVDESNAAQLWSTVYLAVQPPR